MAGQSVWPQQQQQNAAEPQQRQAAEVDGYDGKEEWAELASRLKAAAGAIPCLPAAGSRHAIHFEPAQARPAGKLFALQQGQQQAEAELSLD
eukprot:gene7490-636_t